MTLQQPISLFNSPSSQATRSFAEYFAGIGLVRLGLERAGWEVAFANDFAHEKFEMYSSYYEEAHDHYVIDDIFNLAPETIPDVFLATSSFPCIDLSLAGNLNGLSGKHSSAFWGFIRILKAQGKRRPPLVMLENVPGWLTSNGGADFRITLQALNELGYSCDVFALDAIRFTPQSRLRIFVVGAQIAEPDNNLERLIERDAALAPNNLKRAVKDNSDLRWHILSTPLPPLKKTDDLSTIIEVLSDDDPRWWAQEEVNRHLEMMAPLHRERVNLLMANPQISYRTIYRRRRYGQQRAEVRDDGTAGCLRTARGGSSRQIVLAAGGNRVRMRHMTPREYARLQGVPDKYPIPRNTIQALTGFGDAVCVPAITWIAKNVLNPLAEQIEKG